MKKLILAAVASASLLAGCTTDPYTGEQKISNTAGGLGIGAGAGALGGYLVGRATGTDPGRAALIGAGIGAIGGGGIGAYMDRQEADLRAQLQGTGVSVTRQGDRIILNMPSNITFDTNEDQVRSEFYPTLQSVAIVLNKYDRSIVDVAGNTDNVGGEGYNFALSQRRASSVSQFLASQGVNPRRLNTQGYGMSRPIASNATEAGRAQNRRVEISISPLEAG
ncbi:OmpA family protein [Aureimonas phyllosphaerae]|uniref:Outer membrane protein OmpA-like peptidoglycan-associated protein n=1 Tax=Aureimonas phyllosphaerae TaxID=1166078 RepID=A0A7W6FUU0_9HYPH|nr:OmpA family protein [Aureimonas phyllosphaerae]MBB3936105.1 outer membrane protein OmpA-like peptidoglycan-associated protein [Aureimonas phyllosphaerae]MBB3960170.1 outer membrane protein OmpA-like peptidoglycan-associated protein [Aureimonas phyllosphaerae]SFF33978.1 Outer membrane protein OmpA [Aureimonas phyllosphaerae]